MAFQLWKPADDLVEASTLVAGDKVMVEGVVHSVYDITAAGDGTVRIRFDTGNWTEPVLTVRADALVTKAEMDEPVAVWAAYEHLTLVTEPDTETTSQVWARVEIPAAISEGSVVLTLTAIDTYVLPTGAGQWDVVVEQTNGDTLRVLEGQFSTVETVAPLVPALLP
jgi:hypothetical protein